MGIQGAIGSLYMEPIHISDIIVGGVPHTMQETVREDCERAFWGRSSGEHIVSSPRGCFAQILTSELDGLDRKCSASDCNTLL